MRLLSVKESKNKKTIEESEKIKKLSSLNKEISGKITEINSLKDNKNKKIDQINEDIKKLDSTFIEFENEIREKKEGLEVEVKELEKRKAKALEPIIQRELALSEKEVLCQEEIERLDKITLNLKDLDEKITEGSEEILDKKYELDEREIEVERKEKSAKKQTEFAKKSVDDASTKWLELREWELGATENIEKSKKQNATDKKENEIFKNELDKRQIEIDKNRKHLESQQQALAGAFAEARIKNLL